MRQLSKQRLLDTLAQRVLVTTVPARTHHADLRKPLLPTCSELYWSLMFMRTQASARGS